MSCITSLSFRRSWCLYILPCFCGKKRGGEVMMMTDNTCLGTISFFGVNDCFKHSSSRDIQGNTVKRDRYIGLMWLSLQRMEGCVISYAERMTTMRWLRLSYSFPQCTCTTNRLHRGEGDVPSTHPIPLECGLLHGLPSESFLLRAFLYDKQGVR